MAAAFKGHCQTRLLHSYAKTLVLNINNRLELEMNNEIPLLYCIVCNVMMSLNIDICTAVAFQLLRSQPLLYRLGVGKTIMLITLEQFNQTHTPDQNLAFC